MEYTLQEQIADTSVGKPHVVILGAGASRAAFPNGDRHGKRLPVMTDIAAILQLEDTIRTAGFDPSGNFEEMYATLSSSASSTGALQTINQRVYDYFSSLELPDEATIYDALVLSLREKDVIATLIVSRGVVYEPAAALG